ncbi:MAG: hypothetical protein ABIJ72_04365 [bacterium]
MMGFRQVLLHQSERSKRLRDDFAAWGGTLVLIAVVAGFLAFGENLGSIPIAARWLVVVCALGATACFIASRVSHLKIIKP